MHKFGNSTYCQGQIFYFLKSSTSSRLLTPESWNSLNFKACLKTYTLFVCLFFCEEFILPLENFSLIWRRHLCRWKATKFDLSSALMACEGSLRCHIHCDTGLPFIIVISEDPWHSHLFPSFWQWSCHYLFLRLRSVATGDRTPISCMRGERSTSTFVELWRSIHPRKIMGMMPLGILRFKGWIEVNIYQTVKQWIVFIETLTTMSMWNVYLDCLIIVSLLIIK